MFVPLVPLCRLEMLQNVQKTDLLHHTIRIAIHHYCAYKIFQIDRELHMFVKLEFGVLNKHLSPLRIMLLKIYF